jgi:REP element-mobilizing transposase RayT
VARPLRTDFAGALQHVTSRGNERRPIFHDDRDRETFLGFLGETVRRFTWSVSACVLMTNHFHGTRVHFTFVASHDSDMACSVDSCRKV